ncbi:MAG: M28 family peptidase [Bacteroidetes bacterium]|nr:M28 family peptidase [Bacteroidota bacterium]
MKRLAFIAFLGLLLATACQPGRRPKQHASSPDTLQVPVFSADSAYAFLKAQLRFGPRVPNRSGHWAMQRWLRAELERLAGPERVSEQRFRAQGYGEVLELVNFQASVRPELPQRVLLCAHWDTRPRADRDPKRPEDPIPGADDGASGVAVLLELLRLFRDRPPPIGVDVVFFDGEDYGREGDLERYFLGSRHWSRTKPPDYWPRYGILLDMVGARGAVFYQERYSLEAAPELVELIWSTAHALGYGARFPRAPGAYISDDHVMLIELARVPTVNIIHHSPDPNPFPAYWHTHEDDLPVIDRDTLGMVGRVLVELLYRRLPGRL